MSALPKLAALVLALLPAPEATEGWTLRGAPRTYSPGNLYDYINGNADLFHSYGFQQVGVGDYVRKGGEGWITVDIYDMGAPLHAFGVYSAERPADPQPMPVGVQGYALGGLIAFWTGPYYVKVSLADGDDAAAARALARAADQRIRRATAMPAEVKRLPERNRVPGSERYTKTSALGHDFLGEVVSADYRLDGNTATLYIACLGGEKSAAEGLQKLSEFETAAGVTVSDMPGVGEDAFAVRDPYQGQLVAAWQGRFVYIAVGEGAGRAVLGELLGSAIRAAGLADQMPQSPGQPLLTRPE
jgi:hypothetical protein